MAEHKNIVSIHPYFRPHEGKRDAFLALLPQFVERTATESACLYYDFSMSDELIHCREAYIGAAGAAAVQLPRRAAAEDERSSSS